MHAVILSIPDLGLNSDMRGGGSQHQNIYGTRNGYTTFGFVRLVMGKMKFLSESIQDSSSTFFWNRLRIVSPESIYESILESIRELIPKSVLESESVLESKSALESESAPKRSQLRHRHKNRRLSPIILRIDNRKKQILVKDCKRVPGLISLLKLLF